MPAKIAFPSPRIANTAEPYSFGERAPHVLIDSKGRVWRYPSPRPELSGRRLLKGAAYADAGMVFGRNADPGACGHLHPRRRTAGTGRRHRPDRPRASRLAYALRA